MVARHDSRRPVRRERLRLAAEVLRLLPRPRRAQPTTADEAAGPERRPRALWVSPYYLYPARHGAAIRSLELMRRLAVSCDLHVLVAIGGTDDVAQREALRSLARGVHFQKLPEADPAAVHAGFPARAAAVCSWELARRVEGLARHHELDVVQLENSELGFLADLPGGHRTVQVELDLTYRSFARRLRRSAESGSGWGAFWEVLRWLRFERVACSAADQVHVMSESDRGILARLLPDGTARVRVVPNGASPATPFAPPRSSHEVLFVGSFPHLPNQEALRFLVERIWPRVLAAVPAARLRIAGAAPPPWVLALDGKDQMEVAGEVEDLEPLYRSAAVFAAPILSGSGTRLKILEALAYGVPVVSTRIGVEGLDQLRDGEDFLCADGAGPFSREIVRALSDGAMRERLARAGRRRVEAAYSWDRSAAAALAGYRDLPARAEEDVARVDASGDVPPAEISIVVDAVRFPRAAERFLERLESQVEQRFEVLLLLPSERSGSDLKRSAAWTGRLREVGLDERSWSPAACARAAAQVAAGRILLFADARLVPEGDDWLADLTWPLFQADGPQGVEGSTVDGAGDPISGLAVSRAPAETARADPAARVRLSLRHSALRAETLATLGVADEGEAGPAFLALLLEANGGWLHAEAKARARLEPPPSADAVEVDRPQRSAARAAPALATVVVRCTDERRAGATLRALERQAEAPPHEVILIGRGASELVERSGEVACFAASLRAVEPLAKGHAAARNLAARLARGEWIAFLDEGVEPDPTWLATLSRALESGAAAAAGPVGLEIEGALPFWFDGGCVAALGAWGVFEPARPLEQERTSLPLGSNLAIRSALLRRLGGFDEHLDNARRTPWTAVEWDLLARLRAADGEVRLVPGAHVTRHVGRKELTLAALESRFSERSRARASLDWRAGGWRALVDGAARLREAPGGRPTRRGWLGRVARRLQRAARRGYLAGAIHAILFVPRAEEPSAAAR